MQFRILGEIASRGIVIGGNAHAACHFHCTRRTSTEQIAEVHALIRTKLAARFADGADFSLLYGGSVKPGNAVEIFAVPHVNGALVGGASLKAADFNPIIDALSRA